MADSACLMHAFSYASAVPNDSKPGNPMHALGESISFGRFMTESLAWEKWSSFSSHNKYVEEAERYARPGSVAQKKAFFEAHYKRIAAKKAAALLEQEQANSSTGDGEKSVVVAVAGEESKHETPLVAIETKAPPRVEAPPPPPPLVKTVAVAGLLNRNRVEHSETQDTVSGSELSEGPQMERPLLKNSSTKKEEDDEVTSAPSKRRSALSSFKPSIHGKTSKIPSTPAAPYTYTHLNKENIITPMAPIVKSSGAVSVGVMKPTSKSLSFLLNSTPAKEPDRVRQPATTHKEASQVVPVSANNMAKNCTSPLMTPMATSNGLSNKVYAATPASENGRAKTPINPPASGSKTSGPKWHLLSAVCSKSLSACKNKLQSPTLSTPFRLRTEERAARRKQKLEEKFNAKEVQKAQPQTTLKEKAGTELRKLGRSFCFKARPLPDFYKEREATKTQIAKENPVIYPESQHLGKQTTSSAAASLTKNGAHKNVSKKKNDKKRMV